MTNGDQTDTIYELMDKQQTFEQALRTREFEPDAPIILHVFLVSCTLIRVSSIMRCLS